MQLIRGIHNLRAEHHGSVATIGNYDGVHLGHRAVLDLLARTAAAMGLPALVAVFEPTPQEHFAGDQAPPRLTRLREKVEALRHCGVERLLCLRFDHALATMPARAFIDDLLVAKLGVRYLVVGEDFRFGHARRGDIALLRATGSRDGFEVAAAPTFRIDGRRVSSTAVREALARGELDLAAKLLGRRYSMAGRVIRGNSLGRALGYPTANIAIGRRVSPLHGIFAVRVAGADVGWRQGVASIGTRPTVDGSDLLLEAHLFDFDAELYGRHLEVEFIARLRDEERFQSLAALTEQMHRDAADARAILAGCA